MNNLPKFQTPSNWIYETMSSERGLALLTGQPTAQGDGLPILPGINFHFITPAAPKLTFRKELMKGWQRPGPGPRQGRSRVPSANCLKDPFMMAAIHLTKEAIHFQQLYSFQTLSQEQGTIGLSNSMTNLAELETSLTVSRAMKKSIWTLTHQLGVPAFLMRLKSPNYAIAIHFLPDRAGQQWYCSMCRTGEVSSQSVCCHATLLNECVMEISTTIGCSYEYLVCSMTQSAAFNLISDLSSACFYGVKNKLEFSVIRNERIDRQSPMTSAGRVYGLKRISISQGWKCLQRECAGISRSCFHYKTVQAHVDRGLTHCFSNMYDIVMSLESQYGVHGEADVNSDTCDYFIERPPYCRPLVPSDASFQVDFEVNKNARNGTSRLLLASSNCHCGCSLEDESSSRIFTSTLRVETTRCFVEYKQEIWTCGNGHSVTPEHDASAREGLVWISKHTAYTEVFLFDLLLHMTLGGVTISSQADLRSQMLFLQTNYMSRDNRPRSHQSLRKALIMYAMAVVSAIPAWVFRCSNCATVTDGEVNYDKLSFDGQQIGFNIRKDVRYDFYGKPSTPWRRPVERNPIAANKSFIVQSRALRTIIMEALRVRDVPPGCNSVQSLCRAMMNVSLKSKNSIRAAVAAIRLFDPDSCVFYSNPDMSGNEVSFQEYIQRANENRSASPVQFITNSTNPSHMDFERSIRVWKVFRHVLDCTRVAQMVAVLVNELRGNLKDYIPIDDKAFVSHYAQHSYQKLHEWLAQLAKWNSWALILPQLTQLDLQESMSAGVAEHVQELVHPFRPSFSWTRHQVEDDDSSVPLSTLSRVRIVDDWRCPVDAQTSVLMMFMALLNETVVVWIRNGRFNAIEAAIEVLRNVERFRVDMDYSFQYRAALQEVHSVGLLYEGLMGIIGVRTENAWQLFSATRKLLELIPELHSDYEAAMRESTTKKDFMCSTSEFDDMLLWTGAIKRNESETGLKATNTLTHEHMGSMRKLYAKMSEERSNDFLETGVWAPDFPMRRPSPSSTVWGTDTTHTDLSCSKNFEVHNSFSPGTFGAYCLCKHAKTVMVSFLKRPEGSRMPLNLITERCRRLPKYVIYDFACGTQKAALSLSREMSKHTHFVIDPFHFPGHKTCSLAMHVANFAELRGCNTESQEQRNSSIKVMERTLRACRDSHFIHYMILAHAYLNLKAIYMDHFDVSRRSGEERSDPGSRAWVKWIRDNLFSED